MHKPEPTPQTDQHHQEDTVPDDNAMPQDLFPQLRLASSCSTISPPLTTTVPPYREADRASLNRWHWERHGSDLATFLHAHPVQV
jgi:hypothetical protein